MDVLSSCETTQVVPATTAGRYTTNAMQSTPLLALNTYSMANYRWSAGDGSSMQPLQNIHHYYASSGLYLAKHGVDVTEYGGASSRHFALVRVMNVPATVNAGPDITVYEGQVVTLQAYFEDVEYMDTHTSIWNFGDNNPLQIVAVQETNQSPKATGTSTVTHAWCDDGIYDVSVQVIDNNGGIGIDVVRVTVLNVAPIVVTPNHIFAYHCSPLTLVGHFTDPGWCDKHTATWRFGDCSDAKMGLVVETNLPPEAKGTVTASHCYKACGSYYAECTVIDDDGGIGTSATVVDVICLHNGDFNQGFSYHPAGKVADFWTAFFVSAKGPNASAPNHGEVFFCEKCIVYDGLSSQRIVAPRDGFAGIYQQLGANPNWTYQIDVMYLLRNTPGIVKLGIDPYGQTDPFSNQIVWSEGSAEGVWTNLLQRVCAKADRITIFLGLEAPDATECYFDVTKLVVQQNICCNAQPEVSTVPTPKCVDFDGVAPSQTLPSTWTHDGVTFQTASGVPNRLVETYPSEFTPTLQLDNSMTVGFENPVEDLKLSVAYVDGVMVNYVANDESGMVVSQGQAQLSHPDSLIEVQGTNIASVQLGVTGNAGLSRLCYKELLSPINSNQ